MCVNKKVRKRKCLLKNRNRVFSAGSTINKVIIQGTYDLRYRRSMMELNPKLLKKYMARKKVIYLKILVIIINRVFCDLP